MDTLGDALNAERERDNRTNRHIEFGQEKDESQAQVRSVECSCYTTAVPLLWCFAGGNGWCSGEPYGDWRGDGGR